MCDDEKPRSHRTHTELTNSNAIRDKLLLEIAELRSKLDNLGICPARGKPAAARTFKGIIPGRNELLSNLSR